MENDFRYTMEHLGDIVAGKLESVAGKLGGVAGKLGKVFGSLKTSTRGVVLTYDIHDLEKKRRKILTSIGEQMGKVRAQSPEMAIFNDEGIMKLFVELTRVEDRIENCVQEREARLYARDFTPEQSEA
jgi:hypothetical protein